MPKTYPGKWAQGGLTQFPPPTTTLLSPGRSKDPSSYAKRGDFGPLLSTFSIANHWPEAGLLFLRIYS